MHTSPAGRFPTMIESNEFRSLTERTGNRLTIRWSGDCDTAARDILDSDPDLIEFDRGQLIEVHLSQVTFMDSAGIHNLLALRLRCRASRRPVRGPRRLPTSPTCPGTHRPHGHPRVRRHQSQRPPLTRRRLSDEGSGPSNFATGAEHRAAETVRRLTGVVTGFRAAEAAPDPSRALSTYQAEGRTPCLNQKPPGEPVAFSRRSPPRPSRP